MKKGRLEAFSDGVLAIVITIMVLELKVPHGAALADLAKILPVFLSYVLSFIYIGIYWNNHHHMLHTLNRVNGKVLWANLHLLFWLSLVPFTTGWMGQNHYEPVPTAVYGVNLLLAAIAYVLLQNLIIKGHGPHSVLAKAIGNDWKGKVSPVIYIAGIALSPVHVDVARICYLAVALIWLIPDSRIERIVEEIEKQQK